MSVEFATLCASRAIPFRWIENGSVREEVVRLGWTKQQSLRAFVLIIQGVRRDNPQSGGLMVRNRLFLAFRSQSVLSNWLAVR